MDLVTQAQGVDVCDVDAVVTQAVRELGMIVITRPERWPNGSGVKLRPLVTAELGRLLRRGRLTLECDRPFLYLKPHPETLTLVAARP
jgi:hypothetical protein